MAKLKRWDVQVFNTSTLEDSYKVSSPALGKARHCLRLIVGLNDRTIYASFRHRAISAKTMPPIFHRSDTDPCAECSREQFERWHFDCHRGELEHQILGMTFHHLIVMIIR